VKTKFNKTFAQNFENEQISIFFYLLILQPSKNIYWHSSVPSPFFDETVIFLMKNSDE